MTAAVDPMAMLGPLEQRLAETTNERHRAVLGIVLEHARLEAAPYWDLDRLMATLVPEPAYHFWVDGVDMGPKGADDVRAYYAETVSNRMNFIELSVERLIVDDTGVVFEGWLKQIYPGAMAASMGMDIDDPVDDYLAVFRVMMVLPVDGNGLMEGEDAYISGPARVTKLTSDQLPAEYLAHSR